MNALGTAFFVISVAFFSFIGKADESWSGEYQMKWANYSYLQSGSLDAARTMGPCNMVGLIVEEVENAYVNVNWEFNCYSSQSGMSATFTRRGNDLYDEGTNNKAGYIDPEKLILDVWNYARDGRRLNQRWELLRSKDLSSGRPGLLFHLQQMEAMDQANQAPSVFTLTIFGEFAVMPNRS